MSKRAHQQDPLASEAESSHTKRARSDKEQQHASDCTDENCTGCAVGEVEISFVRKDAEGQSVEGSEPTAQELLAMAIDEAAHSDATEDDQGHHKQVVRRLFDMTIEKFQKDEPDNRVGYATCLVELGKALQVEESISEGLEILRGELKTKRKEETSEENVDDILLKSAGAAITLAASKRKSQEAYFAEREKELQNENGEITDEVAFEELLQKQEQVSKDEIKLYKEAIEYTTDAFAILKFEDESNVKKAQTVLHELRAYGQLLSNPAHKEHSETVLHTVIDLIKKFPAYKENDELLTIWAACILHTEKFLEEDDVKGKKAVFQKAEELLEQSNTLHKKKHGKENAWVWEMFAMLRINQSNMAEDEDEALDLYDEAIHAFKKAHEMRPDDQRLGNMVNMLEGLQAQAAADDEEEEEEEED
ncbi:hypothetical protein BDF20DRAFT_904058 [Mycotypha africana]|uniref:uncharacterized protein n=1 Tax=Mycotypha africana TaxID=64632 RepID=UPI002300E79F|nr:uncharacterized protein BDF20DRAFT_904058 [Mycotypha africana]KAI8991361.1 hypothetical protein BDF20DRAFT_904058 [Mycotypha africana]